MPESRSFARRVFLAAAIVGSVFVVFYLGWQLSRVLLLLLAGILFAVFVDGLARLVSERTPLSRRVGVLLVLVLLFGLLAGAGWFVGPQIAEQAGEMSERIPEAVAQVRQGMEQHAWGRLLLSKAGGAEQVMGSGSDLLGRITGIFSRALSAVVDLLIVIILGIYLALNPALYRDNALRLVPKRRRGRGREVLAQIGHALRWWLVGRFSSMAIVGVLTALGLWLVGLPLALTLGLIAAVLSFVPYIGPALSVVPGVLVAFSEGSTMVVYVLAVYGAVQFMESYLVTPLIQERVVAMPPAVLITMQVVMGLLAGALGVLLATPLAIVVIVSVQMLYVEDVLGEKAQVLGNHD